MDEKKAFEIVFNKLTDCSLFNGIYDARHGSRHFVYGIGTVMECIAYFIDDETGDRFTDEFNKNMVESENKAEQE